MNFPYIKEFDSNGTLLNPIDKAFISTGPNRAQRRAQNKTQRFRKNSRGTHLTVLVTGKYKRFIQEIKSKNSVKQILHYILS